MIKGWENLSYEEVLREMGLLSLEKVRGSQHVYKYLKTGYKEDGARLFLVVPNDRKRSSKQKLKHGMFCLTIRKHFFHVRVTAVEQIYHNGYVISGEQRDWSV